MPTEVTKPRDSRRPAAPIPSGKTSPQDQISPPLMVDGLEAVRDPYCSSVAYAQAGTKKETRRSHHFVASLFASRERRAAYSLLSMFQKIGVAGPSKTPVSDLRQPLASRYWPSGM